MGYKIFILISLSISNICIGSTVDEERKSHTLVARGNRVTTYDTTSLPSINALSTEYRLLVRPCTSPMVPFFCVYDQRNRPLGYILSSFHTLPIDALPPLVMQIIRDLAADANCCFLSEMNANYQRLSSQAMASLMKRDLQQYTPQEHLDRLRTYYQQHPYLSAPSGLDIEFYQKGWATQIMKPYMEQVDPQYVSYLRILDTADPFLCTQFVTNMNMLLEGPGAKVIGMDTQLEALFKGHTIIPLDSKALRLKALLAAEQRKLDLFFFSITDDRDIKYLNYLPMSKQLLKLWSKNPPKAEARAKALEEELETLRTGELKTATARAEKLEAELQQEREAAKSAAEASSKETAERDIHVARLEDITNFDPYALKILSDYFSGMPTLPTVEVTESVKHRNIAWVGNIVSPLLRELEGNGYPSPFFAVCGAAHNCGEYGIPHLLMNQGFRVELCTYAGWKQLTATELAGYEAVSADETINETKDDL